VFTPSDPARTSQDLAGGPPADPHEIVRALAEKHGVRPVTATGPLEILDPAQSREARLFLGFRSGMSPDQDDLTAVRAARILHAPPGAPLVEKVMGLSADDPAGKGTADFSHVSEVLDDWAKKIHTPPRYVPGRHVAS
jgi:hypothetical protein